MLFVPHRPPILMLTGITGCDVECAQGIASIAQGSPFVPDGLLPGPFFVELLSQLIAAMQGYKESQATGGGYLVGVHEFDCLNAAQAGDSLHLNVRKTNQVEALHIFEGRVTRGDELLAAGEVRCFLASASATAAVSEFAVTSSRSWDGQSSLTEALEGCMQEIALNASSGKAESSIRFVPEAVVFAGHFPGSPIVPGVIWLEAGMALTAKLLSRQMILRKIVSARFKKPVGPDQSVKMELVAEPVSGGFLVNGQIKSGKTMAASFELIVESA